MDSSENEAPLQDSVDSSQEASQTSPENNSVSINMSQSEQQPMSLYQEFSLLNRYIPNVTIGKVGAMNVAESF